LHWVIPSYFRLYYIGILRKVRPLSGRSIITPVQNDTTENIVQKITEDFSAWDWKREQFLRYAKDYPFGWPRFDCAVPATSSAPEDVHHLAPWHVSVIGAIGDSLTKFIRTNKKNTIKAGRAAGAEYLTDLVLDYRGLSFAMGAEKNLTRQASLFNIFSHFSPRLKGRSSGTASSSNISVAGFNLAVSGAISEDLLEQAFALVKRIKSHPEIDFDNDWKFVNVFIGSNDLCRICENTTRFSVEQFTANVRESLVYLRENLPRAYVNLIPPFHVEVLLETQADNPFCVELQRIFCPCLFKLTKEEYAVIKRSFDSSLSEFLGAEYQTQNFAVGISSGFNVDKLASLGNVLNLAFVALDCFHFSQIAHDVVAKIIWRDLFLPIHTRSPVDLDQFQPQLWDCPSMVILPSMNELDRRAFMEEYGLILTVTIVGE
ncbi:GDSL-like protein, partial [Ancylostoma duodenale]